MFFIVSLYPHARQLAYLFDIKNLPRQNNQACANLTAELMSRLTAESRVRVDYASYENDIKKF